MSEPQPSAAWNYYAITQFILGIRPGYDALEIDPCIPADWDGFRITRIFRGTTYDIEVTNPAHVSKGVRQLTVDGNAIDTNAIPISAAGRRHHVLVELG